MLCLHHGKMNWNPQNRFRLVQVIEVKTWNIIKLYLKISWYTSSSARYHRANSTPIFYQQAAVSVTESVTKISLLTLQWANMQRGPTQRKCFCYKTVWLLCRFACMMIFCVHDDIYSSNSSSIPGKYTVNLIKHSGQLYNYIARISHKPCFVSFRP